MKHKDRFIFQDQPMLDYLHIMIDQDIGVQNRKKVVLHLIGIFYAHDFKGLTALGDPEHQIATVRIGKSGNCLKSGFWNISPGFLEFNVVPFACLK